MLVHTSGQLAAVDVATGAVETWDTGTTVTGHCAHPTQDTWFHTQHNPRGYVLDRETGVSELVTRDLSTGWQCTSELVPDVDGDGFYGPRFGGLDCDDRDPSVVPGTADCPAVDRTCADALPLDPTLDDGIYTIDPDGI